MVSALLTLGLIFGLKHATEVDHIVAVSSIVSEHRSVMRSAVVGALWGLGHTITLVLVGVLVLGLRIAVPSPVANWLEFGVALMIIALGVSALIRVSRKRGDLHMHRHTHDGESHIHLHFHEEKTKHSAAPTSHSHSISKIGLKPLFVGAMHGLAGSAALTLLVLTEIRSAWLGLLYLGVFGVGSAVGMLLMSALIGLPFVLSGKRLLRLNYGMQAVAGCLSVMFGLWYAYQSGTAGKLW